MSGTKNSNPYYTLARWKVKQGKEKEFIEVWTKLGELFFNLPASGLSGTLIQSIDDSSVYYSFGPWDSLEAIQSMRADEQCQQGIKNLVLLCDEASPGTYKFVKEVRK